MPSQKEVHWSQLKVGVLVVVALALLLALVFLISGTVGGGLFSKKITVYSYFENAAGLQEGAPVTLEGVTIGSVTSIQVTAQRKLTPVKVTMRISGRHLDTLHTDSKASLSTIGVLGDTIVDINSQYATGAVLKDGDELHTMETPSVTDVVKASQGTIEQLNVILAKLNALVDSITNGNGSIGQLISSDALYKQFFDAATQINKLASNLNRGKGSIGKLMTDDTFYDRANDSVAKLDAIANELNDGKGTVGKLLKDDTLYNNLNTTAENMNTLIANINAGKGGLGYLANDPNFAKKLDDTVNKLNLILTNVSDGKGTLGQLANNDSLYKNADVLMVESQKLVTTIRQDPKKYLTIRLRIF